MALYTRIKGPVGYTTIGSPTMTDGIATGFSSSNYYKLDTPFLPGNNAWKIVIRAKFNNLTARHTLISYAAANTRSVQLTTTVNSTLVTYLSSNGTSANIAQAKESTLTVQANTWYYFRIRFTKTSYEISVSEDREVWTTYITVNSSTPVWQGAYLSIGYNYRQYPEPMDGYIDFNNSYIQIEDTAFWGYSVSRAKIRTNPFVKYTVVGSPTITTEGVASNFSLTSYCLVNSRFAPSTSSWEIDISFNLAYPGSRKNVALINSTLADYVFPKIAVHTESSTTLKVQALLSSNGTSGNINASSVIVTYDYSKNSYINLKYVPTTATTGNYILSFKQEGQEFTTLATYSNKSYIFQNPNDNGFSIGADIGAPANWRSAFIGSINLNETSLKIDGKYFFNGAMQNVETWTPHIKDN